MFSNMDLDTMLSVLKPKVDGSQYLDECFSESTLDFFIMFGSLASILGNSGQSNYNAANMYMTSLAAQRRKRGLAASVMDLAGIIGVGYLSRAALFTHQLLIRAGTSFTSERDLHQTFAEAVLAGRPDSGRNPEIIAGLRRTDANEHPPVPWYHNPRFSHFVVEEEIAKSTGDKKNTVPVKQELESATNLDEAYQVIKSKLPLLVPEEMLTSSKLVFSTKFKSRFNYLLMSKSANKFRCLSWVSIHWSLLISEPGSRKSLRLTWRS
jgi:hybrid polyketide synthase / nonribosomal peptide synthetase ACE1